MEEGASLQSRRLTRLLVVGVLAVASAAFFTLAPRAEAVIYWTTGESNSTLGRANLNGKGAKHKFITGADAPAGLAITNSRLYWVNIGTQRIARAKLNGTGVNQTFVNGGTGDRLWGLDVAGSRLYWTSISERRVRRASLGGSNVDLNFITTQNAAVDVKVKGKHIYWINYGNSIGRSNLNGSGVNQTLISGLSSEPAGLAVNKTHIFWTNHGSGTIGRARLNGTGVNQNFISGLGSPSGITVTGKHIYWTEYYNARIGRARLSGKSVRRNFIKTPAAHRPYGIAVDWALNPGRNFKIGKAKVNSLAGSARLKLKAPGPGRLVLRGNGLKTVKKSAGKRNMKLTVKPKGNLMAQLNATGSAQVKVKVTFRPRLSKGKRTKTKTVTLRYSG